MRKSLPSKHSVARVLLLCATIAALVLPDASAQGESAIELYRRGAGALQSQDVYQAIDLFRRALGLNPDYLDATVGLAESYFRLNEYDQALIHADRARVLARGDGAVRVLTARIHLAMGSLEQAQTLFTAVLDDEPNNVAARLGLAELAAARGRNAEAAAELLDAYRLAPSEPRTLLALVLVYEKLGERATAERYLDLALRAHQTDPAVQVLAAEHYLRAGELERALAHARTALSLQRENSRAAHLFAEAALRLGQAEEALAMSEQLIARDRNDPIAWYIRGLSLHSQGDTANAYTSLRSALRLDDDDEIIRLVLEELAIGELDLEDQRRSPLAEVHASAAAELVRANRLSLALGRYRQALRLDPYNTDVRRAYAEVHRSLGNTATYLNELEVAEELGASDPRLRTRIEVYQGVLRSSVARRWGVDQFSISRMRTSLWVSADPNGSDVVHPQAIGYLLDAAGRALQSREAVTPIGTSLGADFGGLFEDAREAGAEYLLALGFSESERAFGVRAEVYLARTGTRVFATYIERTGIGRVRLALRRVADTVSAALPRRGKVLDRDRDRVLVDLGRRDGIELGQELLIVESDGYLLSPEDTGLAYSPESRVATAAIVALDDLVAEAAVEVGLVDRLAIGDTVLVPGELVTESGGSGLYPALYHRLRQLQAM